MIGKCAAVATNTEKRRWLRCGSVDTLSELEAVGEEAEALASDGHRVGRVSEREQIESREENEERRLNNGPSAEPMAVAV